MHYSEMKTLHINRKCLNRCNNRTVFITLSKGSVSVFHMSDLLLIGQVTNDRNLTEYNFLYMDAR